MWPLSHQSDFLADPGKGTLAIPLFARRGPAPGASATHQKALGRDIDPGSAAMSQLTPFHLAFKVDDPQAARRFYGEVWAARKGGAAKPGSTSICLDTKSLRTCWPGNFRPASQRKPGRWSFGAVPISARCCHHRSEVACGPAEEGWSEFVIEPYVTLREKPANSRRCSSSTRPAMRWSSNPSRIQTSCSHADFALRSGRQSICRNRSSEPPQRPG